ncbi:MAG: ParA family protein [Rhodothermia bacterium]|nr:ParA family protein [Rhodothermia bacterium]
MTVLTFANHKGGTGKTTSALCVAAALGMSGRRVLVVDLDPQCFLTRMVGVSEPPEESSSLTLFSPDRVLAGEMCERLRWFDLLPASSKAPKFLRSLSRSSDVLWVRESLNDASLEYDVVVIDTAAAVTAYSLGALVAAHLVIIPIAPEYQPVIGGEQCFATVQTVRNRLNPDMMDPRLVLTQVDARKRSHHSFRSYLRQKYGAGVLRSEIRTSAILSQSYSDGTSVFDHRPGSRGAIDYANLTDEILSIIAAGNGADYAPGPTEEFSHVGG